MIDNVDARCQTAAIVLVLFVIGPANSVGKDSLRYYQFVSLSPLTKQDTPNADLFTLQ